MGGLASVETDSQVDDMSTAEILKAIDATPARSKGKLMAKLHQRLEDFYDVQAVAEAHKRNQWVPFEEVQKAIDAKRAKARHT